MTTLCIDELSRRLKRDWGWPAAATHVPLDSECPLLWNRLERVARAGKSRSGRSVPHWLKPKRGHDGPPGIHELHGKASPSMG